MHIAAAPAHQHSSSVLVGSKLVHNSSSGAVEDRSASASSSREEMEEEHSRLWFLPSVPCPARARVAFVSGRDR
jgi:hypothetical protein